MAAAAEEEIDRDQANPGSKKDGRVQSVRGSLQILHKIQMKTVPFNQTEALMGRLVQPNPDSGVTYPGSCDGRVQHIHGGFVWVVWSCGHSQLVRPDNLVHEDLTPEPAPKKPIDLLALNWPAIWVRPSAYPEGASLILTAHERSFYSNFGTRYHGEYGNYQIAPTPAGPWRPMME